MLSRLPALDSNLRQVPLSDSRLSNSEEAKLSG
jgi:hypothetical protein